MVLHGVYRGLLNGVYERGEGGFLYVRGDEAAYMFPHELQNQDKMRDGLQEILQDESAKHFFYVLEEKDGKGHVLAYPRQVVQEAVLNEYGRGNDPRVVLSKGEDRVEEDLKESPERESP